jgi:hypothetical protein
MKVEVSNGELLDKFSILQIKMKNITDVSKLKNVKNEYNTLLKDCTYLLSNEETKSLYDELKTINEDLWKIEDDIRECEEIGDFGLDFIELARAVYFTNDKRAEVKKKINLASGSDLIEEKSYKGSL